ncbi:MULTISPECIES: hypothetical protein [unclassified Streptomyces]|uniref:hypothetical protein n=1 Tax=unclassified Streptomyces TaxID=2593676 RepID=UPI00339E10A7
MNRRSRRLWDTTNTDEKAVASPAVIGSSSPAAASGGAPDDDGPAVDRAAHPGPGTFSKVFGSVIVGVISGSPRERGRTR